MKSVFTRRKAMHGLAAAALAPRVSGAAAAAVNWPPVEGSSTPKICLGVPATLDAAGMRRLKQVGVDYVLMGGPRIPWDEAELRTRIERFKAGGLTISNMMISGFPNTLYGRPGRDEEI